MIDAIVTAPNGKIYLFSRDQYIRYDFARGRADPGYPRPISTWDGLWHRNLDAAIPGQGNRSEKIYFFKGAEYMRYDSKKGRVDSGYPKKIAAHWDGLWEENIDAAVIAPNNGKMYFFRDDEYIRYDFQKGRADGGYPRSLSNWDNLWRRGMDAAVPGQGNRSEKIYFFKGDQYMRWQTGSGGGLDRNYPRPIGLNWQGVNFKSFLPETHGFHFVNSFQQLPDLPDTHLLGELQDRITSNISVAYGLCGGMSLAARDFYLCGRSIPANKRPPQEGALFEYLWQRQLDSFEPAHGYRQLRRFIHFYLPTTFTRELSVAEVKKAKKVLDSGMPALLGLVYVRAPKGVIWDNHQVLAYDYRQDDKTTIFSVYDPNDPDGNVNQIFATEKRGHKARPRKLWMDMSQIEHSELEKRDVIGLIAMDVPAKEPPPGL